VLLEDLPNAAFPKVSLNRSRIRFPAYHDPNHRFCFGRRLPNVSSWSNPQIKKTSPNKFSFFSEKFEGCLPADPLIRAEPFRWLQRLDLGQFFPALFPATPKDFSSSSRPCSGEKTMFVATFSFGRLICSFHEAWIIVKIVWNIQFFVAFSKEIFAREFSRRFSLMVFLPKGAGQKSFPLYTTPI
jgi:hypothetical protein